MAEGQVDKRKEAAQSGRKQAWDQHVVRPHADEIDWDRQIARFKAMMAQVYGGKK